MGPLSAARPCPLSRRELEVLALTAEGLSRQEIADRLYISSRTVNNHRTNIFRKLDLHNAASAVAVSVRSGWLTLPTAFCTECSTAADA